MDYIYTKPGGYILSCLLGVGLASLFRDICKKKSCMIYVGPKKEELTEIYKWNNKCFKVKENHVKCDSTSKRIVPFNSELL